jgi:DNA-binding response OmpR family regulator
MSATIPVATPRILLVEDRDHLSTLYRRVLVSAGYVVDAVGDGHAALDAVAAQTPDLILLDVQIPGISGLDVCRRLKEDSTTKAIPIVLMTGMDSSRTESTPNGSGADDVLSKPFECGDLLESVRAFVAAPRNSDDSWPGSERAVRSGGPRHAAPPTSSRPFRRVAADQSAVIAAPLTPFAYRIDAARGALVVKLNGDVTLADVRAFTRDLLADPAFSMDLPAFFDARYVTRFLSPDEMRTVSQDIRAQPRGALVRRRAVVAHKDFVYGTVRMLEFLTQGAQAEYRAFRAEAEAWAWLLEPASPR